MGRSPEVVISVGGVEVKALVDTGSQVTTLPLSFVKGQLSERTLERPHHFLKLTAANGGDIPLAGVLADVDVVVNGETVKGVNIMVTHDNNVNQCLLGMNVLQQLTSIPLQPKARQVTVKAACGPRYARSGRSTITIPANTCLHVAATAGDPAHDMDVQVEPRSRPPRRGLIVMPIVTTTEKGQVRIPVLNPTDEAILLPTKTVLGDVSPYCQPYNLHVEATDEGGDREAPGARRDHLGGISGGTQGHPQPKKKPDWSQIHLSDSLSPDERLQMMSLIEEFSDVFAWDDEDVGFTDLVEHRIHLTDDTPKAQPYRRVPPSALEEVKQHIEDLLQKGIIRPSSSPYAAPIVCVRKKDGKLRMCCDYRQLNDVTRRDMFPLPRIDQCLDSLSGAKLFSTLDLASGYHQVAMAEEDKYKTAFICPFGLYEWNRVSFGLCNAPATFQRLMNMVMSDFIFRLLIVYLDDLLIHSKTFGEQLTNLRKVFQRLREVGVKLNPPKCFFAMPELLFLGHQVSEKGIGTNPELINDVLNFPIPKTAKDIRKFLGLAGYYRRFVPDFSKIARPLNSLIQQVHVLHPKDKLRGETKPLAELWTMECTRAFQQLRTALTEAPVLAHPDFSRGFIVETDAAHTGLGAVLSQQQEDGSVRVISYASRTLRVSEKQANNYSSLKLELMALKWAITEKFRPYLLGRHCLVYTDNNPLSHIKTAKFSAVEQRWIAELNAFNFTVTHKPGRLNSNADCLSRYPVGRPEGPDEEEVTAVCQVRVEETSDETTSNQTPGPDPTLVQEAFCEQILATGSSDPPLPIPYPQSLLPSDLAAEQQADPQLSPIYLHVQQGTQPTTLERRTWHAGTMTLSRHRARLRLQDGVLQKRHGDIWVPVLPSTQRNAVLQFTHDSHGHQGADRTLGILETRCYWPNMSAEVTDYCNTCERCNIAKPPGNRKVFKPRQHLVAGQPLEILAIDYLTLDQDEYGYEDVLVMTDVFSKFAAAATTKNQTAESAVKALVQRWIVHYGVPLRIHSDKGAAFEAELVQELCRHYGIKKSRTTSYNPAGNGVCERFNQSLCRLLKLLPKDKKRRWSRHLDEVTFVYNSTPHTTTGQSPYALLYGREASLPVDVYLGREPSRGRDNTNYLSLHLERLSELRQLARDQLERHWQRDEQLHPPRGHHLQPGDRVLLKQHPRGRHKLEDHHHSHPFTVVRTPETTSGYYTIRDAEGIEQNQAAHNLKPFPVRTPPAEPVPLDPPVAVPKRERERSPGDEVVFRSLIPIFLPFQPAIPADTGRQPSGPADPPNPPPVPRPSTSAMVPDSLVPAPLPADTDTGVRRSGRIRKVPERFR